LERSFDENLEPEDHNDEIADEKKQQRFPLLQNMVAAISPIQGSN